jgi:hypothetical protein
MSTADDMDLDWYIDNVVVPSGIDRQPVGPVRAWQGRWNGLAQQLSARTGDSLVGTAVGHALEQGFVLTLEQARGHGLRDADLRRLVRRGAWTSLGAGVVSVLPRAAGRSTDDHIARRHAHALDAVAAVLRRRDSIVGSASAAVLHGLPLLQVPELPELEVRHQTATGRRPAAWIRLSAHPPEDDDHWFGAPVAPITAAIGAVARRDPRSGLMAADAALHEKLITASDVELLRGSLRGTRGSRRAIEVLTLADSRIESPLESLTHLALYDSGFPRPEPQTWLRGADGKCYRVDFFWPDFGVVLEADGKGKYGGDALWAEKRREIALTRAGYSVVRVRWADLGDGWRAVAQWLRELMAYTR